MALPGPDPGPRQFAEALAARPQATLLPGAKATNPASPPTRPPPPLGSPAMCGRARSVCCQRQVWRRLPRFPHRTPAPLSGVLAPKTRSQSHPTRRGRHRPLETEPVASSKKGALKEGRIPVFMDESAYYLLPAVVSTWAPVGQPPLLRTPLTRDHLSALGAVTPGGAATAVEATAY